MNALKGGAPAAFGEGAKTKSATKPTSLDGRDCAGATRRATGYHERAECPPR